MIDLTTPIIPYEGTEIFKLDASYDEVKALLQSNNVSYKEEISRPNEIDPPWYIIGISKDGEKDDAISITFSKNRLFRICLYEDFAGTLLNGIHTGMNFNETRNIDTKLQRYEDWDEIFISPDGYFVEYSNRTLDVIIITIFIPALERDDFFEYKW